jgi:hypothetical protein
MRSDSQEPTSEDVDMKTARPAKYSDHEKVGPSSNLEAGTPQQVVDDATGVYLDGSDNASSAIKDRGVAISALPGSTTTRGCS